jgi:hypothetical protein
MTVRKGGNSVIKDTYGEPEIIRKGNIVAKVYSPILTDEERNKRIERIKQASIRIVLSQERKDNSKDEQQDNRQ